MVIILGDIIADLAIRINEFPVNAQDLKPITYLEIGPGGATNIAIMAARFGLPVACLGEVGHDTFGEIVVQGLKRENIETRDIITRPESKTPVAGVLVDKQREPAYLGYMGNLTVRALPDIWRTRIAQADALFADGWIEIPEMSTMILEAFQHAKTAGVKTFFDPGPGNPAFGLTWHLQAAALSTVLLLNQEEAARLTGLNDSLAAARFLLQNGSELVVLKRGGEGLLLVSDTFVETAPALPITPVDFTGAGDSVTGAVIYGVLKGLDSKTLGILANAAGATKVQKLGTGHNMPTLDEIRALLPQDTPFAAFYEPPTRN